MRIKKQPSEVWTEYEKGINFNQAINLYETVDRNEDFYNDKQWGDLNAPDLDKPVFNFLKPVVNYYIAQIISDDIGVNIELLNNMDENLDKVIPDILSKEVSGVIERCNLKYLNRKVIRNCAVDGDACLYFYFDAQAETGYEYTGKICAEIIDNTNVLFGNPSDERAEVQPYIIIAYRTLLSEAKEEAKENGENPDLIEADDASYITQDNYDFDNDYVTILLKMWKQAGEQGETVHFLKCTKNAVIKKETDTLYKKYPLAYITWESQKNCYHGVSPLTGKIQNQIFVNKLYAMAMEHVKKTAFPKILYDKTKMPDGWNAAVGKAVAVTGNPSEAIFANFAAQDMSGTVMGMIQSTITQSKEMMGAYDAALGNVTPDNTSAIVATQKAAAAPLDLQRMDFYNFVESYVRIILEMMRVDYGAREIYTAGDDGIKQRGLFDFSEIGRYAINLDIEIGQASYWSELMQVQTLDNLMAQKIIPTAELYLKALPNGYVRNKDELLRGIREFEEMQMGLMQPPPQAEELPGQDIPGQAIAENAALQQGEEQAFLDGIISELIQLSPEAQEQAIDALNISDEEKAYIRQAMKGGDEIALQ